MMIKKNVIKKKLVKMAHCVLHFLIIWISMGTLLHHKSPLTRYNILLNLVHFMNFQAAHRSFFSCLLKVVSAAESWYIIFSAISMLTKVSAHRHFLKIHGPDILWKLKKTSIYAGSSILYFSFFFFLPCEKPLLCCQQFILLGECVGGGMVFCKNT